MTGRAAAAPRASGVTGRPPQQDRSRATRQQILEAAVECLAEVGWSRCTVALVASRAAVSRGALQHHFPTREDLFIAAVGQVVEARGHDLRRRAEKLPAGEAAEREAPSTREVVDTVFELCTGTVFAAALELWVASAADPALRASVVELEAKIGKELHRAVVDLLHVDERRPGTRELIQATLDLARGLGLANLLTDDARRRAGIAARWAEVLDHELGRVP